MKDMKALERVQKGIARMGPGMRNYSYQERVKKKIKCQKSKIKQNMLKIFNIRGKRKKVILSGPRQYIGTWEKRRSKRDQWN